MKHTFKELESKIIQWGVEKGIIGNATPVQQFNKTFEEVEELESALYAQQFGYETFQNKKGVEVNTKEEIIDSIGDITVTLLLQCELQGISFLDCLDTAYNVIKKRTGRMIDGQFVKDE